jgi:SAM-dependent methyltransferase
VAEHHEVYRQAYYYDVIFKRDVSRELDFMTEVYEEQTGRALRSILDIACGPGYHARAFAHREVRASGLDLRAEMIDYARLEARQEGVEVEWIVGDMRDFKLAQPVDMAFTVFDGMDCMMTNEEILQHFQAVAANLNAKGLYLIDLSHPRDCSLGAYMDFRYSGERDGVRVELEWGTNRPAYHPLTQIADTEVTMRVHDRGQEHVFVSQARERFISAQEIILLTDCSSVFQARAWYGAYDRRQVLDNTPASRRMIAILQKIN